jgi:hypothetical protein
VDWKVPAHLARLEQLSVRSYAKLPHVPFETVDKMPLKEWMPRWWGNKKPFDKALLILSISAALFLLFRLSSMYRKIPIRERILIITLLAGIAFWFISAPDPRFAYGTLWFTLILGLYYLTQPVKIPPLLFPILQAGGILALLAVFVAFGGASTMGNNILHPAGVPTVPLKQEKIHGATIYLPQTGNQCWDAALPCTPSFQQSLRLRGDNLQDGFRIQQP